MRALVGAAFREQDVLEISCGTAYWTEAFASSVRSVVACDINSEVLDIARAKKWGPARVEFIQADSYALPDFARRFSGAFSGFWWSHIPKRRISDFLSALRKKIERDARVMFIDNRYVEGSNTPIYRTDGGDTYQLRRLEDGSTHEVLKNFPSEEELLFAAADVGVEAEVTILDYFWILTYKSK